MFYPRAKLWRFHSFFSPLFTAFHIGMETTWTFNVLMNFEIRKYLFLLFEHSNLTEEKPSVLKMQTTRLVAIHEVNTTVLKKFIPYSVETMQLFRLWPLRYSICCGNL